jgi:GTP-binding protein
MSNFIDHVRICCRSGKGGDGKVHFHRDRFTQKGGPDGGDGGRGGHIYVRGSKDRWTLVHLRYHKHVIAGDGEPGGASNKHGADGEDVVLELPLGTVITDLESGEKEMEVVEDGEEKLLLPGGKGGKGNTRYKSSTRQTPRFAQDGEPGREEWKVMELKVLADVGLVGKPNAGKSTLLSVLSAAKPRVADHPFTTTEPQLGVVPLDDLRSFVMADIPGLIEGAHEGRGMGYRFLRHVERNATLLFLIPADSDDPAEEYRTLLEELKNYDKSLLQKERVLAISKSDMLDRELRDELAGELPRELPVRFISAVSEEGLQELKELLWNSVKLPEEDDGDARGLG